MMHFKTFYVEVSIICKRIKMGGGGAVFSQKFSSAGKGLFMGSNAKKCPRKTLTLLGEGGSGVRDMAPLLLWNLEAKFSEKSLTHF